jgi:acetylglutamate kinase
MENSKGNKISISDVYEVLSGIMPMSDSTIVVKYGGLKMDDANLLKTFAEDVALLSRLGANIIVVHGGGPQVSSIMSRLNIKNTYLDNLMVTDKDTAEVMQMVLSGSVNQIFVDALCKEDVNALGMCGKDCNIMSAKKIRRTMRDVGSNIERIVDLGFLGEPDNISLDVIFEMMENRIVPVISPVANSQSGQLFIMNADTVASKIAATLKADKLILITEQSMLSGEDGNRIKSISSSEIDDMVYREKFNAIHKFKIQQCLKSIHGGTSEAFMADISCEHVLLSAVLEIGDNWTKIHQS